MLGGRKCLLWAIALLCVAPAGALVGEMDVVVEGQLLQSFKLFGFEQGGSVDISARLSAASASPVELLMCSVEQLQSVREPFTLADICSRRVNLTSICTWSDSIGGGFPRSLKMHRSNMPYGFVYFLYSSCATNADVSVHFTYSLLNPGGEQLSVSQIPYKPLLRILLWIWAALLLLWLCNLVWHRRQTIKLHLALAGVPAGELIKLAVSTLYWQHASKYGNFPPELAVPYVVLDGVFKGLLFASLLMVSNGWCVTRQTLEKDEWRGLWGRSFAYAFTIWGWSLFNNFFFLSLHLLMYVVLLRYIFSAIAANLEALLFHLHILRQLNYDATTTPYWKRLVMFKQLRGCLLVFVSADVMLRVWSAMALRESPWVQTLLDEACTILLALAVGWLFRLRAGGFSSSIRDAADEHGDADDPGGVDRRALLSSAAIMEAGLEISDGGMRAWRAGERLPDVSESRPSRLLAVQPPRTRAADGSISQAALQLARPLSRRGRKR